MYDKLLKELKKGNAILVEVSADHPGGQCNRHRLVTPNGCFYVLMAANFVPHRSCFVPPLRRDRTPENIVARMKQYDMHFREITKMQVLR